MGDPYNGPFAKIRLKAGEVVNAGKLVGAIAKLAGGGGGGKPDKAQAGGKDPAKLPEALAAARELIAQALA